MSSTLSRSNWCTLFFNLFFKWAITLYSNIHFAATKDDYSTNRENLIKLYFQIAPSPTVCFVLELERGTMCKSTELGFLQTMDHC